VLNSGYKFNIFVPTLPPYTACNAQRVLCRQSVRGSVSCAGATCSHVAHRPREPFLKTPRCHLRVLA
jgi:hypothetical protein